MRNREPRMRNRLDLILILGSRFSVPHSSLLCLRSLLGFRQRPFAGFVPDLITREPAPRSLHGEYGSVFGGVPAAGGAGRALPPHAQRLAFEQMRAVFQ